ncbi:MAG: 4-hydroxy-3-methylbut-2-enyl diphosphate reductase [Deltaproteobacteria bacterium]|nr:4-hydroxy-3-methylbut-2-enyl diphosphate reductase [Deltaproteobacteria bacterium]
MKVKLARTAGFCMGVRRAMDLVLGAVRTEKRKIFTHGPLIHNPQVLDILRKRDVHVTTEAPDTSGHVVVIRAHGIPVESREKLVNSGQEIIDATCPKVIKVQALIDSYAQKGYLPMILGDDDHPEVIGLISYSHGRGIVIKGIDEIPQFQPGEKVLFVAQTTQDKVVFEDIDRYLRSCDLELKVFNTICDATQRRQDEVRNISQEVEAMVIVGGFDSGNTQRLAKISREAGRPTFHVETDMELAYQPLAQFNTIGVSAGASTPSWMIQRVVRAIENTRGQQEDAWRGFLYSLVRFLVMSNLLVALGAGALGYTGLLLMGMTPQFKDPLIPFFYCYSMHLLNYFLDQSSFEYNDPDRITFYERHRFGLIGAGVGSMIMALVLVWGLGLGPFILLAVMSALGLLYGIQVVPHNILESLGLSQYTKLKDIPGSKTFLISVAWATVICLVPAMGRYGHVSLDTFIAFGAIFLLVFIRSAFFDLIDMQGDLIVGQETLAIALGEDKTRTLLNYLTGILFLWLVSAVFFSSEWLLCLQLLPCPLFVWGYLRRYDRHGPRPGVIFEGLVESNFLLAGLIGLIHAGLH